MKKIVIIGSKGQLGHEFQAIANHYPDCEFHFFDKEELDIVQEKAVNALIDELQPLYLVNCAAYTAVDKAETDKEIANLINNDAVGFLAAACARNQTKFLHISTDYVFDGNATRPYKEDEAPQPASVYGETKLAGERIAFKNNSESIVIRTAWVYSIYGHNFVKTMLRLMRTKESLNVVADQVGSPTYAADLAEAVMHIIDSGKWISGIYHFSNEGVISWFDFAVAIQQRAGLSCAVHPISTSEYPTAAKRPQYSVLDKSKIQQAYQIQLKDWKESLQKCLALMPQEL